MKKNRNFSPKIGDRDVVPTFSIEMDTLVNILSVKGP